MFTMADRDFRTIFPSNGDGNGPQFAKLRGGNGAPLRPPALSLLEERGLTRWQECCLRRKTVVLVFTESQKGVEQTRLHVHA